MYGENNVIKIMQEMENIFMACAQDAEKFAEGNNSAGTRVRKYMQQIKNMAQDVRVEVQHQKNSVVA
tara:strand:+ start:484 stop:684 length:201 start_codon:yes stop_codon:yes gene_type:complete